MILHISQTEKNLRTKEYTINNYLSALDKSHNHPKQTKKYNHHSLPYDMLISINSQLLAEFTVTS